jgi:hypothetical protein
MIDNRKVLESPQELTQGFQRESVVERQIMFGPDIGDCHQKTPFKAGMRKSLNILWG